MSTATAADFACPHCRRQLAFVKPIRRKTATCRWCGSTFEAKRWMVVASWTSCFVLLALALSSALIITCQLVCWLARWEEWIGLTLAGALTVPLVTTGGRLGTTIGGIVSNKCGLPAEQ